MDFRCVWRYTVVSTIVLVFAAKCSMRMLDRQADTTQSEFSRTRVVFWSSFHVSADCLFALCTSLVTLTQRDTHTRTQVLRNSQKNKNDEKVYKKPIHSCYVRLLYIKKAHTHLDSQSSQSMSGLASLMSLHNLHMAIRLLRFQ